MSYCMLCLSTLSALLHVVGRDHLFGTVWPRAHEACIDMSTISRLGMDTSGTTLFIPFAHHQRDRTAWKQQPEACKSCTNVLHLFVLFLDKIVWVWLHFNPALLRLPNKAGSSRTVHLQWVYRHPYRWSNANTGSNWADITRKLLFSCGCKCKCKRWTELDCQMWSHNDFLQSLWWISPVCMEITNHFNLSQDSPYHRSWQHSGFCPRQSRKHILCANALTEWLHFWSACIFHCSLLRCLLSSAQPHRWGYQSVVLVWLFLWGPFRCYIAYGILTTAHTY